MIYDLAIIGGGPAGVSAGVYAARKRLKTVFITKDFLGQSSVSDGIENWIGTIKISGTELSKNLENHLKAYASDVVEIKEGENCENVSKISEGFLIKTKTQEFQVKTVLITAGSRRRKLEIPGAKEFDNKGLTYCATCDGPLFADKDVVVIGGGNAAFETAGQLLAYCKSVTLLNRSEIFKADEVTVKKILSNPKMKAVINVTPVEIKGDKFVNAIVYQDAKTNEKIELKTDGIFVEIGLLPNTDFIKDVVNLNQYNQIIVDPRNQRASTSGIWSAGDCTDGLYHQNNIASGDAVRALEDIYTYLHLQ
ncbi:MAG: FAD-dependent oxidoreductase [Patescibacteria group bacterium]|nr:FAD-dependent oxidoreductase [Patescibacteria group bacterium]